MFTKAFHHRSFHVFKFNSAIPTEISEGIGLLTLFHQRVAVGLRLEWQGVAAPAAIKQTRSQIRAELGEFGLNPSAFEQGNDVGVFLWLGARFRR